MCPDFKGLFAASVLTAFLKVIVDKSKGEEYKTIIRELDEGLTRK
jgi:hypothetical protein